MNKNSVDYLLTPEQLREISYSIENAQRYNIKQLTNLIRCYELSIEGGNLRKETALFYGELVEVYKNELFNRARSLKVD